MMENFDGGGSVFVMRRPCLYNDSPSQSMIRNLLSTFPSSEINLVAITWNMIRNKENGTDLGTPSIRNRFQAFTGQLHKLFLVHTHL